MLFFNIDHLEESLSDLTQAASAQFFAASASMCEVFAHMERADFRQTAIHAQKSADQFVQGANSFRKLALAVKQHSWIEHEIRNLNFVDVAQAVGLSSNSGAIQEVSVSLVRGELAGVLMSCADEVEAFANDLHTMNKNLSGANLLPDLEYDRAHKMLGKWRTLVIKGQYVSSACLSAAKVGAVG
jgi:hypothetical protein